MKVEESLGIPNTDERKPNRPLQIVAFTGLAVAVVGFAILVRVLYTMIATPPAYIDAVRQWCESQSCTTSTFVMVAPWDLLSYGLGVFVLGVLVARTADRKTCRSSGPWLALLLGICFVGGLILVGLAVYAGLAVYTHLMGSPDAMTGFVAESQGTAGFVAMIASGLLIKFLEAIDAVELNERRAMPAGH